jgi:hypothetical protein
MYRQIHTHLCIRHRVQTSMSYHNDHDTLWCNSFFINNISYIKFSCWILILLFQQKHTRNFVHNHNLLTTTNANKLFHFHFLNCIKIYIQTFQEHPSPRSLQYTIGNPQTPTIFFNLLALIGQGSPWVCDAFPCCPSLKRAGNLRRKTIVR